MTFIKKPLNHFWKVGSFLKQLSSLCQETHRPSLPCGAVCPSSLRICYLIYLYPALFLWPPGLFYWAALKSLQSFDRTSLNQESKEWLRELSLNALSIYFFLEHVSDFSNSWVALSEITQKKLYLLNLSPSLPSPIPTQQAFSLVHC